MLVAYVLLGYYIPRTDFVPLFSIYAALFGIYAFVIFKLNDKELFNYYLTGAFLIRMAFLFAIPALSDDYFRFFWDGELIHQGINPYTHLPSDLVGKLNHSEPVNELYKGMNSPNYFSVYPPLAQLSYYLATFFTGKGLWTAIISYKVLILIAEMTLVPIMIRLLKSINKPKGLIFIYLLNPLVILEFTGNLHGEVFVILGLLTSMWLMLEKRYNLAAIVFGLTVSFKLLPLIFLPLILRFIGLKIGIRFSIIALLTLSLTFIPFIDQSFIHHITESLGLYFNVFEFNSSIAKLANLLTNWVTDENHTTIIGKISGVVAFFLIVIYSFKSIKLNAEGLFQRMSFLLMIYLLFAMSIHPWYAAPLIAFAIFMPIRYGILWSFLIFMTYITYQTSPYQQNSYVIALEYLLLFTLLFYYRKKRVEIS